jgi:hypothetical protein
VAALMAVVCLVEVLTVVVSLAEGHLWRQL